MKTKHLLAYPPMALVVFLAGCSLLPTLLAKTEESPTEIFHISAPNTGRIGQAIQIEVWAAAGPAGNYDLKSISASVDHQSRTVTVRATKVADVTPGKPASQSELGYKRASTRFTPLNSGAYHISTERFSTQRSYPMAGTPAIPALPTATLDIEVTDQ